MFVCYSHNTQFIKEIFFAHRSYTFSYSHEVYFNTLGKYDNAKQKYPEKDYSVLPSQRLCF